MCAINPVHKKRMILDVYTAHQISKAEFEDLVCNAVLLMECKLNSDMRLRWHVKETEQEAD